MATSIIIAISEYLSVAFTAVIESWYGFLDGDDDHGLPTKWRLLVHYMLLMLSFLQYLIWMVLPVALRHDTRATVVDSDKRSNYAVALHVCYR